jgi:alkylation response protein AidB-like acyl-CoA dehydrogenase
MTELTPTLRQLRALGRELAAELRTHALAVDADPMDSRALKSPALELLRLIATPRQYRLRPIPRHAEPYTESCLARTALNVELARGDAGVLNSCAAPSLAGLAVDALGDQDQRAYFYGELARHQPWTFFGMTERERGSDATAMTTRLDPGPDGGYLLSGGKRYISNAERGTLGVVFARTGPTALSIRAALVRQPAAGITARPLRTLGLRGACLGELDFDAVHVPRERVLGAHLPASRRGMWGVNRTFNVMRLQIGAQALGVAYAIRDYVRAQRPPGWTGHELVSARLAGARALLYASAARVDADPDDRRPPSLAKLHATTLAVEVSRWAEAVLEPGAPLAHPLLEKWCRDAYAFEFMDGTSNIQRLTIAPTAALRREQS